MERLYTVEPLYNNPQYRILDTMKNPRGPLRNFDKPKRINRIKTRLKSQPIHTN